MSIIDQAAKRLEQLRAAGIEAQPGVFDIDGTPARPRAISMPMPVPASGSRSDSLRGREPSNDSRNVIELDLDLMSRANLLVPNRSDPVLARDFRAIKQTLVAKAVGAARAERGNLLVVTSALPGEGKTFCSINLALSMAGEIDKTVLLIDGDVAKPAVPARLGIEPGPGLLDLLVDPEVTLQDVLYSTNIPKLSLIQAGRPRANSAELLASEEMRRLLDDIADSDSNRIVVIDAPPLLATIDARILAHLAGQVLIIVQAGRTTQNQVTEAFAMVAKCPLVMSVLNRRPGKLGTYHGAYGY